MEDRQQNAETVGRRFNPANATVSKTDKVKSMEEIINAEMRRREQETISMGLHGVLIGMVAVAGIWFVSSILGQVFLRFF